MSNQNTWKENEITIFSTGTASYRRSLEIEGGQSTEIVLPVRSEHLDDVLGSLMVSGAGISASAATVPLSGERDPAEIEIDSGQVVRSILVSMVGSKVRIEHSSGSLEGTLIGLQPIMESDVGVAFAQDAVVIDNGKGFQGIPFSEMESFQFLDEASQAEVEKALRANQAKVHEESALLSLKLSATESGIAVVEFTQAAPAWSLGYRIRELDQSSLLLEGHAVVHNTSGEDWNDVQLNLVVGYPNDFKTDLADVVEPHRDTVRLIDSSVQGNISAERDDLRSKSRGPRAASFAGARSAMGGLESADGLESFGAPSAYEPQAEASQVAAFCRFSSKERVSIAAGETAMIPVLSHVLADSAAVLFYNPRKSGDSPSRAVKFSNNTGQSLGKGVCTVSLRDSAKEDSHIFAGRVVLPDTQPGEERILPHMAENRVRVHTGSDRNESRLAAVKIADGVIRCVNQRVTRTPYSVRNTSEDGFEFVLEHPRRMLDSTVTVSCEGAQVEELTQNARVNFSLPPVVQKNLATELVVVETSTTRQQIVLTDNDHGFRSWIQQNLIGAGNGFEENPGISQYIELQQEIDRLNHELSKEQRTVQQSREQLEEVRQNLLAVAEHKGLETVSSAAPRWAERLVQLEEAIFTSQHETQPALRTQIDELQELQLAALSEITLDWSA